MKNILIQEIELFVEDDVARRNILHLLDLVVKDAYTMGQVNGISLGIQKLNEVKK
jgi:hypothetical protein